MGSAGSAAYRGETAAPVGEPARVFSFGRSRPFRHVGAPLHGLL